MSVGAFLGIFAVMFLLELPDKTMVATIVMSTRARPSSIVLGASAGFMVQMAIAVSAGGLISLLPAKPKDAIIAVLFLGGAATCCSSRDERSRKRVSARRRASTRHAAA